MSRIEVTIDRLVLSAASTRASAGCPRRRSSAPALALHAMPSRRAYTAAVTHTSSPASAALPAERGVARGSAKAGHGGSGARIGRDLHDDVRLPRLAAAASRGGIVTMDPDTATVQA